MVHGVPANLKPLRDFPNLSRAHDWPLRIATRNVEGCRQPVLVQKISGSPVGWMPVVDADGYVSVHMSISRDAADCASAVYGPRCAMTSFMREQLDVSAVDES